jgi:hypothetical protein
MEKFKLSAWAFEAMTCGCLYDFSKASSLQIFTVNSQPRFDTLHTILIIALRCLDPTPCYITFLTSLVTNPEYMDTG